MDKKELLDEIVFQLLKNKIPVELILIELYGEHEVAYIVSGFSKSGTATLFYNPVVDGIFCETRYSKILEINSFEDLSNEAWYWYLSYKDREPFQEPSEYWTSIWVEEGKLKPVTTYVTKFERS